MNIVPLNDFKFLGKIDVSELIKNVLTFTDEQWQENTQRQTRFRVHKDTLSIPIIWDLENIRKNIPGKLHQSNYNQLKFDLVENQLLNLCNNQYGEGKILRVLLPKLPPGGLILPHKDRVQSLFESKRIHIPLITDEKVLFTVGKTLKTLNVGEVWEIDNSKLHSVQNKSKKARIHLVVDFFPEN